MKKLLLLLLLFPSSVAAQTVIADRFTLRTGACTTRSGTGTPEGFILGNVCDTYVRTDIGAHYLKVSGASTTTGWMQVHTTISTPLGLNLTLNPTGDLVVDPVGNDIFPGTPYDINIGSLQNKFLSLHAAELWVETLVAQNTIATIGGRVLVAPTNILVVDLAPASTTISVKYNNFFNGDRIYMEADAKVEFMAVASNGSGAGPYSYAVIRNLDGTGANQWYAGDAILNTGTTGNGFIDLYSTAGILSGSGPAIVGNVRTGTTYNSYAPRWAIGNLNSLYGYASSIYGAAFGDASATNVTVDATNGFRIRSATTNKFVADTAGNLSIVGDLTVGTAGIIRSAGASAYGTGTGFWIAGGTTPVFRIGNPAGNRLSWDGTTLTIAGVGTDITSISGGNITTGSITATQIAASTITATQIAASTITADKLNVTNLNAITANIGSCSFSGSDVVCGPATINSNGIIVASGGGTINSYRFSDGSGMFRNTAFSSSLSIYGGSDPVQLSSNVDVFGGLDVVTGTTNVGALNATDVTSDNIVNSVNVTTAGLRATDLSGTGNAHACVDANGIFFRGSPATC